MCVGLISSVTLLCTYLLWPQAEVEMTKFDETGATVDWLG